VIHGFFCFGYRIVKGRIKHFLTLILTLLFNYIILFTKMSDKFTPILPPSNEPSDNNMTDEEKNKKEEDCCCLECCKNSNALDSCCNACFFCSIFMMLSNAR
jgi:hypothetical protein